MLPGHRASLLREALEKIAELGDVMDSMRMSDGELIAYAKRIAKNALED